MQTILVKFLKHSNSWDIGFEMTLSNEELSKCDMGPQKHDRNFNIKLEGSIMSIECNFLKENLNVGESIFDRFGLILTCAENTANSHLIK